jgi:methionyl-tRNA synthetase
VARVMQAERVEGSDKLLRLQISVGDLGTRQIVAGIAQATAPEQIAGRKIIVVANLKPAVIFKQESHGMLLAAKMSKADLPQVILVDDAIPEGARLG